MLVAINIFIFALGFVAALATSKHPKNTQLNFQRLRSNLRQFLSSFGLSWYEERSVDFSGQQLVSPSASRKSSFDLDSIRLLTKLDIESEYDINTWQRLAYEDFKSVILAKETGSKTFPCIYATMGYRSDSHRYVFLDSDDPSEPRNLRVIAPALQEYLDTSTFFGLNTSLVIIAAPSIQPRTLMEYNNNFWNMLRGLRIKDPKPWPSNVPQETTSEKWTFCFNDQQIFPVLLTPAHQQRWSRHASVPIIALQPKWVLDKLLSTPERRKSATDKVRKLLVDYDQVDISPDLTSYGQPGTSEVYQLCLLDENKTARCPYENFDE